MTKRPETPELDRLLLARERCRTITEFLDWAWDERRPRFELCEPDPLGGREAYAPAGQTSEQLVAEYCELDQDKIEDERRALLEWQRSLNENPPPVVVGQGTSRTEWPKKGEDDG